MRDFPINGPKRAYCFQSPTNTNEELGKAEQSDLSSVSYLAQVKTIWRNDQRCGHFPLYIVVIINDSFIVFSNDAKRSKKAES